jgi:hypothetical protein
MASYEELTFSMSDEQTIAILILAHANPAVFHRLVQSLDHPRISVFCHIDSKSDISHFNSAAASNVTFIDDRKDIFWGGYRMIEAELALFRAARGAGPFAAYALISGDSLPLIDNNALLALLSRARHTLKFVEQVRGDKSYARIERIYLPDTSVGCFSKPGTHLDRHLANEDFEVVRRAMAVRRLKRAREFRLFKGSQWFSISDALLVRMLDYLEADPSYEEIFRFSAIPDELFFQSLLKIIEPEAESEFGLMGVDWSRKPMPYVMRSDREFDLVRSSETPFFRKFADNGISLVDKVLAQRLTADQCIGSRGPLSRALQFGGRVASAEADETGKPERPDI